MIHQDNLTDLLLPSFNYSILVTSQLLFDIGIISDVTNLGGDSVSFNKFLVMVGFGQTKREDTFNNMKQVMCKNDRIRRYIVEYYI